MNTHPRRRVSIAMWMIYGFDRLAAMVGVFAVYLATEGTHGPRAWGAGLVMLAGVLWAVRPERD